MVSEVMQRSSQLDSKLVGIVGWAAATMAFLLFQDHPNPSTAVRLISALATFSATLAVVVSFLGVKTTMSSFPSELDWFKQTLLDNIEGLKQYHVVSMLNAHQQQHIMNVKKANRLRYSEWLLAISVSLIALVLLLKLSWA